MSVPRSELSQEVEAFNQAAANISTPTPVPAIISVEEEQEPPKENAMDVDNTANESVSKSETPQAAGLKDNSTDPTLNSQPEKLTSDKSKPSPPQRLDLTEVTKSARNSLQTLPVNTLFIELDQLLLSFSKSSDEVAQTPVADLHQLDLPTLFPELQTYTMIDVAPGDIISSSEGKKKGDKKGGERDDPYKRTDEATYAKLNGNELFMRSKPILVSVVQPARRWRKGKWVNLDESPVLSDTDTPTPVAFDENSSGKSHCSD
jgi:chromatin modification-related protein VID21